MQARTEEDVIAMRPVQVTLGTKEYPLKPLTIDQADAWRQSLDTEMQEVMREFEGESDLKSAIPASLAGALIRFPKKILQMVFLFSPEIKEHEEEIKAEASEEQVALAFGRMMSLAYPFVAHLGVVTQVMRSKLDKR